MGHKYTSLFRNNSESTGGWNRKDALVTAKYYRALVTANNWVSKVKVKWSRYRPGVAQRVGRGIALLSHDRGNIRGWVVSSTPRPHFTPGKDPVPILQEAGWVSGPLWTGGKPRPHRDSIPDRLARSQSLYRLSYRAHNCVSTVQNINVKTIENVYEILYEPRIMCYIEVLGKGGGVNNTGKETDERHGRFGYKVVGLPICTEEMELWRGSMLCGWQWHLTMHMGVEDTVRKYYEWQVGNGRLWNGAKQTKLELRESEVSHTLGRNSRKWISENYGGRQNANVGREQAEQVSGNVNGRKTFRGFYPDKEQEGES